MKFYMTTRFYIANKIVKFNCDYFEITNQKSIKLAKKIKYRLMKYAILNNQRSEAIKGGKGSCPNCGSNVIAKCGVTRINHWSHYRNSNCDDWWEVETEWHRNWKNSYPIDWQEISMRDAITGEKHIADIVTNHNIVIEFQHSHIDPKERLTRENFYSNMLWVVDGTRLKRDYPRFQNGIKSFKKIKNGISRLQYPEDYINSSWLESQVPVVFDFFGLNSTKNVISDKLPLYCLFPIKIKGEAIIAEINRNVFLKTTINGEWTSRSDKFLSELTQIKKEIEDQINRNQRNRENRLLGEFLGRTVINKRKRF
jgi:competence protein CoiA